jgi:Spy/CpxP family protein refolding chaperone
MNISNNFKSMVLALAVAGTLGLSFSAMAQNNDERGTRLAERLDLTTEQQEQIDALRAAHREEMREMRDQREQARSALHDEIRAILTPEQAEEFDAMEHRRAERRAERGDGVMRGERGEKGNRGQREDCRQGQRENCRREETA